MDWMKIYKQIDTSKPLFEQINELGFGNYVNRGQTPENKKQWIEEGALGLFLDFFRDVKLTLVNLNKEEQKEYIRGLLDRPKANPPVISFHAEELEQHCRLSTYKAELIVRETLKQLLSELEQPQKGKNQKIKVDAYVLKQWLMAKYESAKPIEHSNKDTFSETCGGYVGTTLYNTFQRFERGSKTLSGISESRKTDNAKLETFVQVRDLLKYHEGRAKVEFEKIYNKFLGNYKKHYG